MSAGMTVVPLTRPTAAQHSCPSDRRLLTPIKSACMYLGSFGWYGRAIGRRGPWLRQHHDLVTTKRMLHPGLQLAG